MRTTIVGMGLTLLGLACCTAEESDVPAPGVGGSSGGHGGSGAGVGGACDPRETSSTSATSATSGSSAQGVTATTSGIDLGGGEPPPAGRLKCWDPDDGSGFDCEFYELECCEKKDVCWSPETEPGFCDRPYCE
jgi:hypothetical protein